MTFGKAAFVSMAMAGLLAPAPSAVAQTYPIVVLGAGDITAVVDQYRKLLGEDTPDKRVRQEINWDGVDDSKAAPAFLPEDIFRSRGAILTTPGKGVQVSARPDNPGNVAPHFGHINASYVQLFKPFSGGRMFSPVGSNIVDLRFVIPDTNTAAVVRGFGAVYLDVDLPHTAFEYYDWHGRSLGRYAVPIQNNGYSFLGVIFDQPIVARVRIAYGSAPLGPDDGPDNDVAVMDDFLYDVPQPIRRPSGPPKRY